jgi:protein arginine kinase activator
MIPGTPNGFSIHNLLSGLLDFDPTPGTSYGQKSTSTLRCDQCGLTYGQFSKLGRFGCSSCYKHFTDKLDPLLKRVHGNVVHVGKVPKRSGGLIQQKREIEQLKQELQARIQRQEFEYAATLRDQIKELENKFHGTHG